MEKEIEAADVFAAFDNLARVVNAYAASAEYDSTVVCEAAAGAKLEAEPFSQMLMQYFDWELGQNTALKQFLVETAAGLGPDHIDNLRRSVAFMQKVESF